MEKNKRSFSSKIGILFAAVGASVGLGNIWRFPYVVGENGGGAFILIYLLLCVVIAVPLVMFELAVGRRGGTNAVDSINKQTNNKILQTTGYFQVAGSLLLTFIYYVIAGWVLYYLYEVALNNLSVLVGDKYFSNFLDGHIKPVLFTVLFGGIVLLLQLRGIKKGIEWFNKVFIPVLFILLIVIMVRSLTLPNASQGVKYIFSPDWSYVLKFNTWTAALGQLFFSVGIGMGIMLTYGSYADKKENLVSLSAKITFADTMAGLLAALAIFPAVFSFGIDPTSGTTLMFTTIPKIFNELPFGNVFAVLFFFGVFIAALSSAVSCSETVSIVVEDKAKIGRTTSSIITNLGIIIVAIFASLSLSTEGSMLNISKWSFFDFIDIIDVLTLVIAGLMLTIVVKFGIRKNDIMKELTNEQSKTTAKFARIAYILNCYVAPVVVGVLLILNIYQTFFKK